MANEIAEAMRQLGFLDGKNIEYLHRFPKDEDHRERLKQIPALAAELVRASPHVLVAGGTALTTALVRATSTIPIVTSMGDPVGAGFAKSLARPGGNVTGVALASRELYSKHYEYLKAMIPGNWGVAYIVGDANPHQEGLMQADEHAARQNGIPVHRVSVKGMSAAEADRLLAAMKGQGIRAVAPWVPIPGLSRKDLAGRFIKYGLVSVDASEEGVARGDVLMAYDSADEDTGYRKASVVARILRGTPPGEIPFELPTRFRLVISASAAKALGLTIPEWLRLRADHIYE